MLEKHEPWLSLSFSFSMYSEARQSRVAGDGILDVLRFSDKWDAPGVQAYCIDYLGRSITVTNWHFSRSFHFLFYCIDTCCYSLKFYSSTNSHSLPSISPSNFVSDHQENQTARVFKSQNVANTTLRKLQRTARFKKHKTKRQDYLIVRQNDRTSNPL